MFKENDMIIYGSHGVCKIIGQEEKNLTGETKTYFVLKPVKNNSSTYFIPADNERLATKMRRILSKEEIDQLIDSMPEESANWIENENERREQYKKIISEGNHTQLIRMIKAIFYQKKVREADGKRLLSFDEHFFKDAKQILHSEFQYVLNFNEDELLEYIFKRIEKNNK